MTSFNLDKINSALARLPSQFDGKVANVGWFETAEPYEDGSTVASVAAQNEFGNPAKRIPPRPFMRPTFADRKAAWTEQLREGAAEVQNMEMTGTQVLDMVGLGAAGDISKTISQLWTPALAKMTVEKRAERTKSGKITPSLLKPLVDTGHMLATLTAQTSSK